MGTEAIGHPFAEQRMPLGLVHLSGKRDRFILQRTIVSDRP